MSQVCLRCKKPIPLSAAGHHAEQHGTDTKWGTENGLHLTLDGGYAEFIDAYDGPVVAVLCHECAHGLADYLNLDVHNWHTHVHPKNGGFQHPDHHDGAHDGP